MNWFDGKKTNIAAGLITVATFMQMFDIITADQLKATLAFLAAFGLYSVKSAVKKLEK